MKKIMFNDKYGLTQAVLDGRKTMTRRVAYYGYLKNPNVCYGLEGEYEDNCILCDWNRIIAVSAYKVDEVVAIAQSYETMANGGYIDKMLDSQSRFKQKYCGAGYKNKMFVKAELMPHHIRITGIRIEHLQDISDDDCLREGVLRRGEFFGVKNVGGGYNTARGMFEWLIDKVSGKGTWERNPWVFVYEFELVD